MFGQEGVNLLSWPCLVMSVLSLITLIVLIRASYVMGQNATEKQKTDPSTYAAFSVVLVLVLSTWFIVKFVD